MARPDRTVLVAVAAAVVVTGYLLGPWRPAAEGLRGEPDLQRAWQLEEPQRACARHHGQMAVAAEVVAGRLTLLQAAARVRAIRADEPPLVRELARWRHPGLSEEEWLCAVVIDHVGWVLADDPARQAAVVGRLQAELRRQRQCGLLRLPLARRDD
jgi:hypothetical protein